MWYVDGEVHVTYPGGDARDLDRWVWSSEWSELELYLVVCIWDRDGNESQGLGRDQELGEIMVLEEGLVMSTEHKMLCLRVTCRS